MKLEQKTSFISSCHQTKLKDLFFPFEICNMYYLTMFLWLAIWNCGISSTTTTNMLRGKHLRVIWVILINLFI